MEPKQEIYWYAIFTEDGIVWGSMVCRDLRLEEKWECVSTSVTQEQQVSHTCNTCC